MSALYFVEISQSWLIFQTFLLFPSSIVLSRDVKKIFILLVFSHSIVYNSIKCFPYFSEIFVNEGVNVSQTEGKETRLLNLFTEG